MLKLARKHLLIIVTMARAAWVIVDRMTAGTRGAAQQIARAVPTRPSGSMQALVHISLVRLTKRLQIPGRLLKRIPIP